MCYFFSKTGIGSPSTLKLGFWEKKNYTLFFSNTYTEVQQKADSIWKFQYYQLVKDYQSSNHSLIFFFYNALYSLVLVGCILFIRYIRLGTPEEDTTTESPVKGRSLLSQNNGFINFPYYFYVYGRYYKSNILEVFCNQSWFETFCKK